MEIVHRPGASHKNSDALSHRPCAREMEEIACRQCRRTGREKGGRTVRVMTRRQLSATAKLEEKTKGISKYEMDLSTDAIREVQRAEIYLQTIMDPLDAGTEKPPWATVDGADLDIQQLYAEWKAL